MPSTGFDLKLDLALRHFFDRGSIKRQVPPAERRGLSRAGAFIRKRARSKLRRRKRVSRPGEPPSVHSSGNASVKIVVFVYEPANRSVTIGPIKLNHINLSWIDLRNKTVPEILEFGDVVVIQEKSSDGGKTWRRRDRRRNDRPWETYRKRRAIYRKRPFMGPALREEIDAGEIVGSFKNVLGPVA